MSDLASIVHHRGVRLGFSIIELLTVVGIMLVAAGLVLPAIQFARSRSRNLQCVARLRQIGLATHLYHEAHGMLPGWIQTGTDPTHLRFASSFASIHTALLPHLDQASVYDRINMDVRIPAPHVEGGVEWRIQSTAAGTRISGFLCPEDPNADLYSGQNSYRGNWGVGPHWSRTAEYPDSANGAFTLVSGVSAYALRFSHFYDGLHKTAMFTERLIGSGDKLQKGSSDILAASPPLPRTAESLVTACIATERLDAMRFVDAGRYWIFTGLHHTLYTHAMTPNAGIYDCQYFDAIPPWGDATARSFHGGTVNVLFCDGSSRTVADTVDLSIWRAVGTRDGGEVVPIDSL